MKWVVLLTAAMPWSIAWPAAQGPGLRFHHLHLAGGLEFYARLFDPAVTRRTTLAGYQALQSGQMLMLFGRHPGSAGAAEKSSAIWHFGWGDVTVGETYLRHAAREVEWEPPVPADKLHVHVVSTLPASAAAWYRDLLQADVDVLPGTVKGRAVAARGELRLAEAMVQVGGLSLLIYRTDEELVATRGQLADHIAFECADLDGTLARLRAQGVTVLEPPAPFGTGRAALIEGPDKIGIELIGASPRAPDRD